MANSASISLNIDLRAFNEGLKTALKLGTIFGQQLNEALSGKAFVDTSALDAELAKYETYLSRLNSSEVVINAEPAVTGIEKITGGMVKAERQTGISVMAIRDKLAVWGFAIRGIRSLWNIAGQGIDFFIGASRETERLQQRLVGLYQDTELAAEAYAKFTDVAKRTPATLQEVTEAGATLKAFGLNAVDTLESVVDLAAYMGMDLVEAASAVGRSFAGGVGASEIFRERGVLELIRSFSGIEDLTTLTLPEFRKVMLETFVDPSAGIAGSAARIANSLAGATSNFEDAIIRLRQQLGNGLLPILTKFLQRLITVIDGIASLSGGMRAALVVVPLLILAWYKLAAAQTTVATVSGVLNGALWTLIGTVSRFMWTIGPVGWALMAVGTALGAYAVHAAKANKVTQETTDKFAEGKKEISKNAEELSILGERLVELKKKTNLTTAEQAEMKKTVSSLNSSYGQYLGNINLEKDAWGKVAEALKDAREKLIEYKMAELFKDRYDKEISRVANLRVAIQELEKEDQKWNFERINNEQAFRDSYSGGTGDVNRYFSQQNEMRKQQIAGLKKDLGEAQKELTRAQGAWSAAIRGMSSLGESGGEGSGQDTGESPEEKRAKAMDSYYREMRFKSASYYEYQIGVYVQERNSFIQLTGEKAKADEQYYERVKKLGEDKAEWEKRQGELSPEEQAALKERESLVNDYYERVKFADESYYTVQIGRLETEKARYIELTGDKVRAEANYNAQVIKLNSELQAWQEEQAKSKISAERKEFELKRGELDAYLAKLEIWKSLELNVTDEMAKAWGEYHALLKEQSDKSEKAYKDAESGKTEATKEELAILKALYEGDLQAYLEALDKKKQADLKFHDDMIDKWRDTHKTQVTAINSLDNAFNSLWNNMLDKNMTGKQKLAAMWEAMGMTWYNAIGKMLSNYIKTKLTEAMVHQGTETAKTTATAAGEGTRLSIIKSSLLVQIALKVAAAIKSVAIYMYETFAALIAWLAKVLGPYAIPVALATMGGIYMLTSAFKKGFSGGGWTGDGDEEEIAGVAHKSEVIFEAPIARKNKTELLQLRKLMQGGLSLKQILPSVNMGYAPVPRISYAYAGERTADVQGKGLIDLIRISGEMRDEMRELKRVWNKGIKAKLNFNRRELAIETERGNAERRTM